MKTGVRRPEGCIIDPRNTRMEVTSQGERRMEELFDGGQGPERAVAQYMDKYFSEFSAQDITHLPNLPREEALFVSSCNWCRSQCRYLNRVTSIKESYSNYPRRMIAHVPLVSSRQRFLQLLKYLTTRANWRRYSTNKRDGRLLTTMAQLYSAQPPYIRRLNSYKFICIMDTSACSGTPELPPHCCNGSNISMQSSLV